MKAGRKIRLGITGGIGSGKSYVAEALRAMGVPVYDTDSRAKELMLAHPDIRSELIALLGEEVYAGNVLNKKYLASYLFANSGNALCVNAIVHPRVKDDFLRWVSIQEAEVVAMECAILYEAGFQDAVDCVLMVYAPLAVRISRAMRRDGTTEVQVRARMAAQMDDEEKKERADFVVVNDGIRSLPGQLAEMLVALKNMKR